MFSSNLQSQDEYNNMNQDTVCDEYDCDNDRVMCLNTANSGNSNCYEYDYNDKPEDNQQEEQQKVNQYIESQSDQSTVEDSQSSQSTKQDYDDHFDVEMVCSHALCI